MTAPARRALRPLDADHEAYWISGSAAPVSRAVVRALVAVVQRAGGRALVDEEEAVRLEYPAAALVAVPCTRPAQVAECGRCGHWQAEHGHPAIVSACARYRLRLGPARFKTAEHDGVTYAWVRRMGRARLVFELAEPCEEFPGGTLTVHRYPGIGDGPVAFARHRWPIPVHERIRVLEWARSHVA